VLDLRNDKVSDTDRGGIQVRDEELKHLAGLKNLQALNLYRTQVTDAGLKELVGLTGLQALNLYGTKVTDAGLKHLAGLKNLQRLGLHWTNVTDDGLKYLAGLENLQTLQLVKTSVTHAGEDELRKALPRCIIDRGGSTLGLVGTPAFIYLGPSGLEQVFK
jgi:hypothetical protein